MTNRRPPKWLTDRRPPDWLADSASECLEVIFCLGGEPRDLLAAFQTFVDDRAGRRPAEVADAARQEVVDRLVGRCGPMVRGLLDSHADADRALVDLSCAIAEDGDGAVEDALTAIADRERGGHPSRTYAMLMEMAAGTYSPSEPTSGLRR